MNYDKMSVEELLPLYNWNIINATLGKITEDAAGRKGFELFTAIRKAVIREASAGVVYVARDGADGCPEFRFRCAESLAGLSGGDVCQLCRELIPERQYVLIPSNLISKETP